jgi:hypothetical protein
MTDELPNHQRLVYIFIGVLLLLAAMSLIFILIVYVLAGDSMH